MSYPIFRQIQIWNTGKMCWIGVPYWKMTFQWNLMGLGYLQPHWFSSPVESLLISVTGVLPGAVSRQVSWSMCSTAFHRRRVKRLTTLILRYHVNDFLLVAGWSETSIWTYIKIIICLYDYVWLCMYIYIYIYIHVSLGVSFVFWVDVMWDLHYSWSSFRLAVEVWPLWLLRIHGVMLKSRYFPSGHLPLPDSI